MFLLGGHSTTSFSSNFEKNKYIAVIRLNRAKFLGVMNDYVVLGGTAVLYNTCTLYTNLFAHFSLETPKRVTGKQCRPGSDAADHDI